MTVIRSETRSVTLIFLHRSIWNILSLLYINIYLVIFCLNTLFMSLYRTLISCFVPYWLRGSPPLVLSVTEVFSSQTRLKFTSPNTVYLFLPPHLYGIHFYAPHFVLLYKVPMTLHFFPLLVLCTTQSQFYIFVKTLLVTYGQSIKSKKIFLNFVCLM